MRAFSGLPILGSIVPPRSRASRYRDAEDRGASIRSRLLAVATIISGLVYIVWLWFTINPRHPAMAGLFLTAEIFCLVLLVAATFTVWGLRYKPPEGLPVPHPPSVDVFVTVCGEPLRVLRATLDAVSRIEWVGPLTVYVLDDGNDPRVRSQAQRRGFQYVTRRGTDAPQGHAKAGNLNFGLARSAGELILVLDADQVPQPSILRAMAGYLRFPDVGFIQSRQFYFVPQGDPFFSLDRVFYEAVQLGYDERDTAISCGSGVLYRRAALKENGGFSQWNVVEDLTTSYDLHSRGWRSFYYAHPVSIGLAPADIWGVYRQRGQWALDTMRLFVWDNPLFKRGLSWRSRLGYLVIPLSYFCAGFVFPFFFSIPVWTYLTGGSVLAGSELQFAAMRGIYALLTALALGALFRRHEAGRQFQMLAGLFPVYLSGTLRALAYPPSRESRYRPNNAAAPTDRRPAFLAVVPQLALVTANAVLPFYAIAAGTAAPRLILGNAVISALAIWALLPVVVAAVSNKVWDTDQSPYGVYSQPAHTDR